MRVYVRDDLDSSHPRQDRSRLFLRAGARGAEKFVSHAAREIKVPTLDIDVENNFCRGNIRLPDNTDRFQ